MDWSKIIDILANDKTWTIVASVAGAVAAIAAMITVYHSRVSWQKERESKRPFFIIEKPGIKHLPNAPPFRIQITMENRGIHPADDFEGRILILNADLSKKADFDFKFSVANSIPSNSPTPWYNDSVHLPKNLPPQYVVLAIKYKDPILNKGFNQTFFMKWDGIQDGSTHPDFVYTSKDEANAISIHLSNVLEEYFKKLL